MSTLFILLQASAPAAGGFDWSGIFMIVVLLAIFYFMMVRPQQKKQKEIKNFREALKVGDNVITAGGIYGTIRTLKDTYVILEVDKGISIRVDKGSIYAAPEDAAADESKQA